MRMKINYTTPCCRKRLSEIRHFVSQQIKDAKLSDLEKSQIILAVDEACANAIIHGNHCDNSKELKLQLEINDDRISVEISDIGNYHPHPKGSRSTQDVVGDCIQNKRKGGLGLRLMYGVMDNVKYYSKGSTNICSLTKRL
ncbi:MAG: ATP-binding protein [Chitinophagales bacterium]